MRSLFSDPNAAWAALIIVVLPLFIIITREVEEQLRQRDSEFQGAFSIIRIWIVPLLTVWILARSLFDVAEDNVFIRLLGSALVFAGATTALSALRVVVKALIDRPRHGDRRPYCLGARSASFGNRGRQRLCGSPNSGGERRVA